MCPGLWNRLTSLGPYDTKDAEVRPREEADENPLRRSGARRSKLGVINTAEWSEHILAQVASLVESFDGAAP